MKKLRRFAGATVAVLVALAAVQSPVLAEDEGWKDTAEFGLVSTTGNSEALSFGLKNTLSKTWGKSSFALKTGAVRIETTTKTRAVTSGTTFTETEVTEPTADNYYLNGRYDRRFTERTFWYGGAGWDRNRFAGVKNRYTGVGGIGNVWMDTDDHKFRTDYGVTFTDEEDYNEFSDNFAGARLGWNYLNKLGQNSVYINDLVLDQNLDESSDFRADMINSLAVAMSDRLALKLSLRVLYDNEPSFENLDASAFGGPGAVLPWSWTTWIPSSPRRWSSTSKRF
jgi:putative salt-induced outer membrane protein YdiY